MKPTAEDFSAAHSILIGNLLAAVQRAGLPHAEAQALVAQSLERAGNDQSVREAIKRITEAKV